MFRTVALGGISIRSLPIDSLFSAPQRFLSTAAAIQRGIRRSRKPSRDSSRQTWNPKKPSRQAGRKLETVSSPRLGESSSSALKRSLDISSNNGGISNKPKNEWIRSREGGTSSIRINSWDSSENDVVVQNSDIREKGRSSLPRAGRTKATMSIPYTTPASEFLYGTSVVEAALTSKRRKIYKLYIYESDQRRQQIQSNKLLDLATHEGVKVEKVGGWSWLSLFDKLSHGRPHNGCCLEVSPLKRPTALSLLPPITVGSQGSSAFRFEPGTMSSEDREVNGHESEIEVISAYPRQPFVLLLDGVVDTGNLGGILRSAYFLGADAVAISGSCGHLSPIVLKASAGAAEILPLLAVSNTTKFIDESKAAGWKVFASVAPPRENRQRERKTNDWLPHFSLDSFESPVTETPCILMIGGEGEGLKNDLQKRAQYTISIGSNRASKSTVDSLNVSVATGILVDKFLQKPPVREIEKVTTLW